MNRVLFIDRRNSVRGPIAQAWFNHLSQGNWRASSCGTGPARSLDKCTVAVMQEVGIEMLPWIPKAICQTMLSEADVVVVMGPDVTPDAFAPAFVWTFRDPEDQQLDSYRRLRNDIRTSVEILVSGFSAEEGATPAFRLTSGSSIAPPAERRDGHFPVAFSGCDGQLVNLEQQTPAALHVLSPLKIDGTDVGRCDYETLGHYPLRNLDTDARLRLYDHLEQCESCFEQVFRICKQRDAHLFRQENAKKPGKQPRGMRAKAS